MADKSYLESLSELKKNKIVGLAQNNANAGPSGSASSNADNNYSGGGGSSGPAPFSYVRSKPSAGDALDGILRKYSGGSANGAAGIDTAASH